MVMTVHPDTARMLQCGMGLGSAAKTVVRGLSAQSKALNWSVPPTCPCSVIRSGLFLQSVRGHNKSVEKWVL